MADGKRQQRTVSLYDRQSGWVAVGFEDNKDWNYTDALFGLQMEHQNAIPGVPDLPEPGADPDTYTEYGERWRSRICGLTKGLRYERRGRIV